MVSYASRSAQALAFLKRPYNDVDIFVEDTANHNMWLLIVRSLLSPGRHISSVNMLGGRDSVIDACKRADSNDGRRKLFIIDGDFDFLLGRAKPRYKNLYRIRAYCVENLIIRQDSLLNIALECKPTMTEHNLLALLGLSSLLDQVSRFLVPLFVAYAVVHEIAPSIQTTKYSLFKLIDDNNGNPQLDASKVRRRLMSVCRHGIRESDLLSFRMSRKKVEMRLGKLDLNQIVSGKNYILPLVALKFRSAYGYRNGDEQLKVAAARTYYPAVEPWLARRIAAL